MGFKKMKMRHKILWIFAITWFLAIVAVGIITINGQIINSKNSEIQKNAITLSACKSIIQTKIDSINVTGKSFAVNEDVAKLMSDTFTDRPEEEQRRILNVLTNMVYNNSYIATFKTGLSIALFCSDGRRYANPNNSIIEIEEDENSPIIGSPDDTGNIYNISYNDVFSPEYGSIGAVYSRKFILNGYNHEYGKLAMAISENTICDAFSSINSQNWAVLDHNGIVIASNLKENIGKSSADAFGFSKKFEDFAEENGSVTVKKDIYSYNHDEKNNLTYILVTPYSSYAKMISSVVFAIVIVCIGLIAVLFGLSFYLSKRFTEPLDKLENIMADAEAGNLDVRMRPDSNDEIGSIGKRFDTMIEKLQNSMDNIQRVEQENRKAELKIMELQLKPHFLYNTLSSIIWLANEDKKNDVISITKSLAMFYRLSLSDGREEIQVVEEVQNAKYYTNIQNYRYHDKFKVIYEIDDEIKDCMVPKLMLQPLVENSINYGMKLRERQGGYIKIRGHRCGEELIFEVIDNGDKATDKRIDELNQSLQSGKSGIGTGIVYGRVRHYGDKYSLIYERKDGVTIARINLPIRRENDSDE